MAPVAQISAERGLRGGFRVLKCHSSPTASTYGANSSTCWNVGLLVVRKVSGISPGAKRNPRAFSQPGAGVVAALGGELLADLLDHLPQRIPAGVEIAVAAITEIEFSRYLLAEQGAKVLVDEARARGTVAGCRKIADIVEGLQ